MTLTEQDVISRLRDAIVAAGSQRAFGRQYDISTQYINDVLRGRREPGKKILVALGIERVVRYQPKEYREKGNVATNVADDPEDSTSTAT